MELSSTSPPISCCPRTFLLSTDTRQKVLVHVSAGIFCYLRRGTELSETCAACQALEVVGIEKFCDITVKAASLSKILRLIHLRVRKYSLTVIPLSSSYEAFT